MPKATPETEDGFDMAVLTHERIDEASTAGTYLFMKVTKMNGYFFYLVAKRM